MADDPIEIEFDSEGLVKIIDRVALSLAAIKDRDMKFGKMISPIVFRDIIEHFEKEQGPSGAWPKWSKSYMQSIAGLVAFRRFGNRTVAITSDEFLEKNKPPREPGKKLQDTGQLRNQIRPTNIRRNAAGYEWYNPAKTKKGFPYAYAHDTGGPILPQRQFMWLSEKALDQVMQITFAFVLGNK